MVVSLLDIDFDRKNDVYIHINVSKTLTKEMLMLIKKMITFFLIYIN